MPKELKIKTQRKWPRKCATKRCRGLVTEAQHSSLCGKCRSRQWKQRHPLEYYFNTLRLNARRRGIPFGLTFAFYKELAISSGYDKNRGKTASSLSIHRKDHLVGYYDWNVTILVLSENAALENRKNYVPYFQMLALSDSDKVQLQPQPADTQDALFYAAPADPDQPF